MTLGILEYPLFFIMGVAIVLSAILTIVNKLLVDQNRMKELQAETKKYQKRLMAATKAGDQEELKKIEKDKPKINQMQSEMMKMQMPIFASMLPFFVVFYILRTWADKAAWGEFVMLPFKMPIAGTTMTWLGWYIMCSLPFSTFFRKVFGVR